MTKRRRGILAGISGAIVAALYLAIALLSYRNGLLPVRPFYQGPINTQPYQWVNPPPELKDGNIPPTKGAGVVRLNKKGSVANTVSTDDTQAIISFYDGSIKPKGGETTVNITITPLDPATLAPVPKDLSFDSNAYRIDAVYAKSKTPAVFAATSCPPNQQPKVCPTLLLRFATVATDLYSLKDGAWATVPNSSSAGASLQLFADVPSAGTFVAVGPVITGQTPKKKGIPWINYIGIGIGVLAIGGGLILRRRSINKAKKARQIAAQKRRKRR